MAIVDRFKAPAPRIVDRFSASPDIPPWIRPDPPSGHTAGMLTPAGAQLDEATIQRLERDKPELLRDLLFSDHSAEQAARDMSVPEVLRARFGLAGAKLLHGAKQKALAVGEMTGLAEPGASDRYTQAVQADDRMYDALTKERPGASLAGDILGGAVVTAPIGLGPAALSLRGFGTAAGTNAAISGMEFTPEGQHTALNAAAGGVLGAAGHGAVGLLGKALNAGREATANALERVTQRLNRPPGQTINALRSRVRDIREQEILERAAANNIPLTVGDVVQTPLMLSMDAAMERLAAMGTAGLRRQQAERLTEMLNRERHRYYSLVRAPDDPPMPSAALEVRDGMYRERRRRQAEAGRLYDLVQAEAGDAPLLARNLSQTARDLLDRETRAIPNVEMQSAALTNFLARYTRDTVMSFEGARSLRSRLKSDIRAAQHNRVIGTEEVRVANRLVDAIENDIATFGTEQGGRVQSLLRQADDNYRNNVVPFDDRLTARLMRDTDFDVNLERWLASPARARRIYDATDAQGQAAMRLAVIDRALNFARVGAEGREFISPQRFLQQTRRIEQSIGHIFTGEHARELQGLTRFLRHMEGIDRAMGTAGRHGSELSQTGGAIVAGGAAGTIAGNVAKPGTLARAAGAVGLLRLALASDSGVRLLTAAADVRGPRMDYLWNALRVAAERQQAIVDRSMSALSDEY